MAVVEAVDVVSDVRQQAASAMLRMTAGSSSAGRLTIIVMPAAALPGGDGTMRPTYGVRSLQSIAGSNQKGAAPPKVAAL